MLFFCQCGHLEGDHELIEEAMLDGSVLEYYCCRAAWCPCKNYEVEG